MRLLVQILLAAIVLAAATLAVVLIVRFAPQAPAQPPQVVVPPVEVATVRAQSVRLDVQTQGTVLPRTEIEVIPQVAGRVVSVSAALAPGGLFAAGEALATLDDRDLVLAVAAAKAEVARAETTLSLEEAEAETARAEWQRLSPKKAPPPLAARLPQLAQARAALEAARARLRRAELDLERTVLRVPFAGRVRTRSIDVGSYVMPGLPVARVYATDYAEVRLPLANRDLAFIDVSLDDQGPQAEVTLSAHFAGSECTWSGRIVRTEAQVDAATRMVHLVARVEDPYGREGDTNGNGHAVPLAVGMFVTATIHGRTVDDVIVVPRSALRLDGTILVVDQDDRLDVRTIDVLRAERDRIVLRSGLRDGERLCTTPLEVVADGMPVAPVPAESER